MTWEEVRDLERGRCVGILPVGAVEAHGPHLPLSTDVIIAEAMARACAEKLTPAGLIPLLLPPLWYTAAGFARDFPGTVDGSADAVTTTIVRIAGSLGTHGIETLALANAHLDPAHLAALEAATRTAPETCRIVHVDLTRRAAAERLTEEFRTGACHAGRYEGSVVLAEAPELVRTNISADLPPNPASLVDAIREGLDSFADAGGPRAYFGWPADATRAEGHETIQVLGGLLAEEVARVSHEAPTADAGAARDTPRTAGADGSEDAPATDADHPDASPHDA